MKQIHKLQFQPAKDQVPKFSKRCVVTWPGVTLNMLTPGVPIMDRVTASLEEHLNRRQADHMFWDIGDDVFMSECWY